MILLNTKHSVVVKWYDLQNKIFTTITIVNSILSRFEWILTEYFQLGSLIA